MFSRLPFVLTLSLTAELFGDASLLVCSFSSNAVLRFESQTGSPDGALDRASGMAGPLCARIGPDGLLYVASEGTDSILRFDPCDSSFVDTFVAAGAGGLNAPTGVAWHQSGDLLVASFETDSVLRYDGATGAFKGVFVGAGTGGLNGPDNGMIVGPDGNLYVPSYWSNRVLRFNGQTGAFMSNFIPFIGRPRVLVFDGGFLYVTSETSDAVLKYSAIDGAAAGAAVPSGTGGLDVPIGLALDGNGDWLVSSGSQHKVYRFNGQTGAFESIVIAAGAGGLIAPTFLTLVTTPTPADFDCDGDVDAADLAILLGGWGRRGEGDLDGSGTTDAADLALLLGGWSAG